MADFLYLVPIALGLGAMGLLYEDMDGAAERILFEETDKPLAKPLDSEHPQKN
jgi:nitrogen fixation-related uncharacterized protein